MKKEITQNDIDEYLKERTTIDVKFIVKQKPEPYARARKGRNGFYNPKQDKENDFKRLCKLQLTDEQYKILSELMADENSIYFVHYNCNFYVPIPNSGTVMEKKLKSMNIIRPSVRNGDIDNYVKFVLDALHDVLYTDDKNVIEITANKYYAEEPRSEINATIEIIKK